LQGTDILLIPTSHDWVEASVSHWRPLLGDHAACEKKAASTALAMMFAYGDDRPLAMALSRLAREELRHFEQVSTLMSLLSVPQVRQRPGCYAAGLHASLRTSEPDRKLDLLLAGALIEARSCERFRLLSPRLPQPLAMFYCKLEQAEARHFESYVGFAETAAPHTWRGRLRQLAEHEAELASQKSRPGLFLG
jgi:tRNA-(ms[2]io[6]A)-hydroxylase